MNYVEWCELVLQAMGEAANESAQVRNFGIDNDSLAQRVWCEHYKTVVENVNDRERDDALYDAVFDLYTELLVIDPNATFIKLTRDGRNASKEIFPVWADACEIGLEPVMQNALKIVNKHSNQPHQYFGRADWVPMNTVHCELDDENMTEEDVWEVLGELGREILFTGTAASIQMKSEPITGDSPGSVAVIRFLGSDWLIAWSQNGRPPVLSLSASFISTPLTRRLSSSKMYSGWPIRKRVDGVG